MSFTDKCIEALSRAEISFCEEGLVSSLDNFPLSISYNKSGTLEMFRVVYNGETFYIFKEWLFDTDAPFSLEAVIGQLKDVRMRDKFNYSQAYSFSDVYSKIEHLATPKFKEWYTTKKSDCSWGDSFTDNWDFEIIE